MLRLDEINKQTGLNLNLLTYMRLGEAITFFLRNRVAEENDTEKKTSMGNFLSSFKKGSKPVQAILQHFNLKKFGLDKQGHVIQYFRIVEVNMVEVKLLKKWLGIWTFSMLQNKLRKFIFKSNSNILGTNLRVSHFAQPCPDESVEHLFFSCNTTSSFLAQFEREFLPDFNFADVLERKKFWFLCILPVDKEYNLFLAIAIWCFKFVIWGRKLKKRILSFHSLNIEFFNTMNSILLVSGFVRECKNNAGHFICRNWDNLRF